MPFRFRSGPVLTSANEFATSTKSSLPVIGVDLPTQTLSQLTLDPAWITEDEEWRSLVSSLGVMGEDRRYMDNVREMVRATYFGSSSALSLIHI